MSHIFVIRGNIAHLACDAWMLPTSSAVGVSRWEEFVPDLQARVADSDTRDLRTGSRLTAVLAGQTNPDPHVILTAVPRHGFSAAHELAPAVVEFFETAERTSQGSARDGRARPLVAMPFFGTRGGRGEMRKGPILDVLLDTMKKEARERGLDAALVLRDDDAFALAQLKRSADASFFDELDDDLLRRVDTLAADARSGRLVPFMGAGVSASAGAPTWGALIHRLADEVFVDDQAAVDSLLRPNRDVLDQAAALRSGWEGKRLPSDPSFNELVAAKVDLPRYGLAPALLAALPAKEAITLNYDSLFELAATDIGQPRRVIPRATTGGSVESEAVNERWLLKLHGSVDSPRTIVLTRDDYLGYDSDRGALSSLVKAMLMTRHLLFVGFGLVDDHFHEILFDVRRAVEGQGPAGVEATVLKLRSDPLDRYLWDGDLEVVPIGDDENDARLARRLEIFLDALICRASDNHSYLLKEGFEGALTPADTRLKRLLEQLQRDADGDVQCSTAWRIVEEALAALGAAPGDTNAR